MSTAHLLAFNLGSVTLKAASFAFDAQESGGDVVFRERARIEIPVTDDSHRNLAAAFDALPRHAQAPDVVVHRVVHGGPFDAGVVLDDAAFAVLDGLVPLDPLHQPAALAFARAARLRWPHARHGAAFDTVFHAHLAPWSRRLPVPADLDAAGVRRFGFHGLAFASALRRLDMLAPCASQQRVVVAHLGGGCSVAAMQRGQSVDTTMGMTPTGGVPMPTRAGDLDPGVIFHLLRCGADPTYLEQRLLRESGLAGIAGYGDVRRLLEDPRDEAALAIEQFVMRIAQAIAAMTIAAGGIDHLVFCGGSGSRSAVLRARIVDRLEPLGIVLDQDRNHQAAARIDVGCGPGVWRIEIDEESELAESARAWALPWSGGGPPTPSSTTEAAP